jgi:hypothetical protein
MTQVFVSPGPMSISVAMNCLTGAGGDDMIKKIITSACQPPSVTLPPIITNFVTTFKHYFYPLGFFFWTESFGSLLMSILLRWLNYFPCSRLFYHIYFIMLRARIAQWVWWRSSGWTAVRSPEEMGDFSLLHVVQTGSGVHPTSSPIDTGDSFPGGKAAGREANHSAPCNAEV